MTFTINKDLKAIADTPKPTIGRKTKAKYIEVLEKWQKRNKYEVIGNVKEGDKVTGELRDGILHIK